MNLINVAAILSAVAGFLMIVLGFFLSRKEWSFRDTVRQAVGDSSETIKTVSAVMWGIAKGPGGLAAATQQQQAAITGIADYLKGLAELAKNLGGLTPAVASFTIATILFFFAASLGAISFIAT